jgi:predicted dehydrogenase
VILKTSVPVIMDVIFNKVLYKGFLLQSAGKEQVELDPILTVLLTSNKNQFINYDGTLSSKVRTLLNYLRIYSFSDIMYKIRSRRSEAIRNDKYLAIGLGKNSRGDFFLFINPFSQFYQSKVVVPAKLIQPINLEEFRISADQRYLIDLPGDGHLDFERSVFKNLESFSVHSGKNIADVDRNSALKEAERLIKLLAPSLKSDFLVRSYYDKEMNINRPRCALSTGRKKAVLFGYGNYAKSVVLPFLRNYIVAERIHEIDPVQLLNCKSLEVSTSPFPDFSKSFNVWLIAGYHHTHVDLAVEAFKRGAKAVIEKPLATTMKEFRKFYDFVNTNDAVFFICFQKRYLSFNQYIFADFKIKKGHPINYRAIVYEIPLDGQHWYNWPKSRSRIISNGCHWIDHFFHLNDFCETDNYWAKRLSGDTILCWITLKNGAVFSLTLTDSGSKRQGVREYIELSIRGHRAVIRDSMHYESENDLTRIRKSRISKLKCLRDMYKQIGRSVSKNEPGDHIKTLVSTELSLSLDEMLEYPGEGIPV